MHTSMRVTAVAAALALMVQASAVESAHETLLDLPVVVKTTIIREAAGHAIAALETTTHDGHLAYRVRIAQEGIDKRLTINPDGMVVDITDFPAVNSAITNSTQAGKEAWDATTHAATTTWEASKETVRNAIDAFRSDDLTLNQVPALPRATLERLAAGNRITDIHAHTEAHGTTYQATIRPPDGHAQTLVVRDDGTIEPALPPR
jgi:hypothetical protein